MRDRVRPPLDFGADADFVRRRAGMFGTDLRRGFLRSDDLPRLER